ncbi:MAG: thioesterase family protein [Pseudomonadota bacterium]
MLTNRRTLRVEWAHCDPAKIVFYPQYLIWFDSGTAYLFESVGLPTTDLFAQYGLVGMPLVDVRAQFMQPSRWGDDLIAESGVAEWRRSSFVVRHRLYKGEALAVEGFETRVWAMPHPDDPARIKAQPIPPEIVARLSAPD